jgi:glycosyltransferase involved in cell wall biosynthesis
VILQAFAASVPVVASDWRSIPELVEDGLRGLLVPVKSPERLREALRRLGSDEKLYDSIAAEALAFAKKHSERALVKDFLVAKVHELL